MTSNDRYIFDLEAKHNQENNISLSARAIHKYTYTADQILDIIFALNEVKAKLSARELFGLCYEVKRKKLIFHISENELSIYENFMPVSWNKENGIEHYVKLIYHLAS